MASSRGLPFAIGAMPAPPLPDPSAAFAGRELACRRGERLVFVGLSFAVLAGGALVLTGPNGSGKSSLLRVMAGLTPPESGVLSWEGEPVRKDWAAHRARLHFIGHQDALKPALTVAETLAFWARMRGQAPAVAALKRFGLEALASSPCRLLSAGQRRRVALARLLTTPAPLWLLDEPATSLDGDGVDALLAAVAAHRGQGGRVVLSTHAGLILEGATTLSLSDFAPRAAE